LKTEGREILRGEVLGCFDRSGAPILNRRPDAKKTIGFAFSPPLAVFLRDPRAPKAESDAVPKI
jgi:hypothetical protein